MCGIAGVIDFSGAPIDRALLERFCDILRHRGPDDRGIWGHEQQGFSVGLAHTRLAVIDPTPLGHQPMTDEDNLHAVVYNGELYNHASLRRELGVSMRSTCDTEVVLNACMSAGPDVLQRFDGMWALAYVDVEQRRGHLSRDPLGIKPLYYAVHHNTLFFASELRALLAASSLPTDVDPLAVRLFLNLGYIPHERTIYRGIHKLPPGNRLDFGPNGVEGIRPFTVPAQEQADRPAGMAPSYSAACARLRELIQNAVNGQRVADVPLGAFLSGGLDSSIVVGCLARAGGTRLKTFSIGYPDHPRYDESRFARLVAAHFGTEHHQFPVTFRDVLNTVEPMLNHLGEPFADSSLLPAALVSGLTRGHVTVALSGDGGDELFGGYWRYLGHEYLARYKRWPAALRRFLFEPLLHCLPTARTNRYLDRLRQFRKLLRGDLPAPLDRHLAWSRLMDDDLAVSLLGHGSAEEASAELRRIYQRAAAGQARSDDDPHGLNTILHVDLALGLPGDMLHKVDLASMYHGLEVRVPLLAAPVVDFVTALPIGYRIEGLRTKRILRDAFQDMLPPEIAARGKMGFEVPIGEFLRHELRGMYHDTVTADTLGPLGVNAAAADDCYAAHLARAADHTELLWSLLVLCWWAGRR